MDFQVLIADSAIANLKEIVEQTSDLGRSSQVANAQDGIAMQ